jgi:hypothetical protein
MLTWYAVSTSRWTDRRSYLLADGPWASLPATIPGHHFRDARPGRLFRRALDEQAWQAFLAAFRPDYESLDAQLEGIAAVERSLFEGSSEPGRVDAKTEELRDAHDALAEVYASRLAHVMDRLPADRAVLGMFCDLVLANGAGADVGDIGCGTGRLAPYLAARGLMPHGADLSPENRVARQITRLPASTLTCGRAAARDASPGA